MGRCIRRWLKEESATCPNCRGGMSWGGGKEAVEVCKGRMGEVLGRFGVGGG